MVMGQFGRSISFKVSPTLEKRGKHFFNVIVFYSRQEMYKWWNLYRKGRSDGGVDLSCNCEGDGFEGMCIPYETVRICPGGAEEQGKDLGIIILHRKRLGAGLISHEMLHAALWWDRLVNGNTDACYGRENGDNNGAEERLNYGLFYLVKECVTKLYKHKLI
jgi:hypothetical protein